MEKLWIAGIAVGIVIGIILLYLLGKAIGNKIFSNLYSSQYRYKKVKTRKFFIEPQQAEDMNRIIATFEGLGKDNKKCKEFWDNCCFSELLKKENWFNQKGNVTREQLDDWHVGCESVVKINKVSILVRQKKYLDLEIPENLLNGVFFDLCSRAIKEIDTDKPVGSTRK